MTTWIALPDDTDFTIYNLPFGIFSEQNGEKSVGVAIGNFVVDLKKLTELKAFNDLNFDKKVFVSAFLNDFMALGKPITSAVRRRLQQIFTDFESPLREVADTFLIPVSQVALHLPVKIGDYTDFYSSEEHATNVGKMFRDPANALLPNWKHLPVAYHGRASTIFVSGTPFRRPSGQTRPDDAQPPVFGATRQLDFELEVAAIIGKHSQPGRPISTSEAEEYVFGFVLFNDWSARDIQRWEYVPLGPFLGKNFFSSISPWVIPAEALEPLRIQGEVQSPEVLPYLQYEGPKNYDLHLEVSLLPENSTETIISRSNLSHLYWTVCQQIAHHTCNGCHLNVGDVLASGTISGNTPDSFGSMLELTWAGKNPVNLTDGSTRKFIEDQDTIIFRGFGNKNGIRVGFGEVKNKVLPAV